MKAKVQMTITRVIDLEDEYYQDLSYPDRLQLEIDMANEMPYVWMGADSAEWGITGELIKDKIEHSGQGGTGDE